MNEHNLGSRRKKEKKQAMCRITHPMKNLVSASTGFAGDSAKRKTAAVLITVAATMIVRCEFTFVRMYPVSGQLTTRLRRTRAEDIYVSVLCKNCLY